MLLEQETELQKRLSKRRTIVETENDQKAMPIAANAVTQPLPHAPVPPPAPQSPWKRNLNQSRIQTLVSFKKKKFTKAA